MHTTHEELARQLKEKSFNWLQKSPQILPHQRMFTIMLEPSPATKKNRRIVHHANHVFCCCEGFPTMAMDNTRGCDARTTTNSVVGIKKRFQVILFSRPIGFQDPSLPFLFALLVPFSRRIELRDD